MQWIKNLTSGAQVTAKARIQSLVKWVKGSHVAAARAWIQSLTQELLHAVGAVIKTKERKNKITKHFQEHIRGKRTVIPVTMLEHSCTYCCVTYLPKT